MLNPKLILALGTLCWCLGCSAEPSYEGKSFSQWLADMDLRYPKRHERAIASLVAMGDDARSYLRAALTDSQRDKRCGAAMALLRLDPAEIDAVLNVLRSGEPEHQTNMAMVLIQANRELPAALEALRRNLNHKQWKVSYGVVLALGELTPDSVDAVEPLKAWLASGDATTRWRATYALVRLGPTAAGAVDALTAALKDEDARVREGAAYALGAIGPAAKPAVPALQVALEDDDAKVRFRAQQALDQVRL
mgnify:CR=1 FL=1